MIFTRLLEDDGQEIFDLVANIVHDGEPKDGSYRIHVNHKLTNMWKEIQVKIFALNLRQLYFRILL